MTPEKAQAIYDQMRKTMASGYAFSKHPVASAYQTWRRFNTTPYNSATHGQRHVNNYANTIGKAYGMFEKAGPLPVGSVIAKDSFTVNEEGATSAGPPLFIMEKMAQGFNYVSGDWRYTMIMPDGSIFGQTKGENSEGVKFCISCHLAAEQNDHLHFMPKEVRAAAKLSAFVRSLNTPKPVWIGSHTAACPPHKDKIQPKVRFTPESGHIWPR